VTKSPILWIIIARKKTSGTQRPSQWNKNIYWYGKECFEKNQNNILIFVNIHNSTKNKKNIWWFSETIFTTILCNSQSWWIYLNHHLGGRLAFLCYPGCINILYYEWTCLLTCANSLWYLFTSWSKSFEPLFRHLISWILFVDYCRLFWKKAPEKYNGKQIHVVWGDASRVILIEWMFSVWQQNSWFDCCKCYIKNICISFYCLCVIVNYLTKLYTDIRGC
jgi:hypothetical protein